MKIFFRTVILFAFTCMMYAADGQSRTTELKLTLDESGEHYLKATFLNQVWLRYNESNPGSLVQDELASETFDLGLRRTRFQLFGQLTDHVFFYTQFGQNNFNSLAQNAGNRKLQPFFHDAICEYVVFKNKSTLKLGGGLTIANGLSRFSQPSIGTILSMDVPVFAQATVEQTDQFSRKLSLYARGQLGKFDYRIVISDPFPITTTGKTPPTVGQEASFASIGHHKQYQGFFMYNFFETEPNTTPYMAGTYLGKKKILNLEAGFITQKAATWTQTTPTDEVVYHDMKLWSVAAFYDAPLGHVGSALSGYIGYFSYDFGPGHLRFNGIMNPANGISDPTKYGQHGNAFPMFGTGEIVYVQAGYKFRDGLLGEELGTLLPYFTLMSADFEKLRHRMNVMSFGINWLIRDHASKITLDYQLRPTYKDDGGSLVTSSHRGQWVAQYQIYF